MTEPQFEADIAIVDSEKLKELKEKEKKIERIIGLIKENGLEHDKEFMDAVVDAFDGIEREI